MNQIKLNELIDEGTRFNFENNSEISHRESFSHASPEFLAWISKVENYIYSNFEENSGPCRMLNSVKKNKFNGFAQSDFEIEFNKLKGAIKSCISLTPNKKSPENIILSLIKNPIFWSVLVVVIGAAYKLGCDIGLAKFDNEKIEIKKQNTLYRDSLRILNNDIKRLNDTINMRAIPHSLIQSSINHNK